MAIHASQLRLVDSMVWIDQAGPVTDERIIQDSATQDSEYAERLMSATGVQAKFCKKDVPRI
jgi:hypothetical protein